MILATVRSKISYNLLLFMAYLVGIKKKNIILVVDLLTHAAKETQN